jgi:molybdate transport system substrate-binding protein
MQSSATTATAPWSRSAPLCLTIVAACCLLSAPARVTAADDKAAPATPQHGGRITVLAAASSQAAVKEAARLFAAENGIAVDCSFGGTGALLNQIRLEHFGDVFISASGDFVDAAEKEQLVDAASRRTLCWLTPVICVAKGNPKQIKTLKDLAQPGLRLALPDPKSATIGIIAKAAMDKAGVYDEVRKRVVTYAKDVQHAVSLMRLKEVDATFGYDVNQRQSAEDMDAIPFEGATPIEQPAAVVAFSKQKEAAQRFLDYLAGPQGRAVFARHGYTVDKP